MIEIEVPVMPENEIALCAVSVGPPQVIIENHLVALLGDIAHMDNVPDVGPIIEGNPTVLIGDRPATRVGHRAQGSKGPVEISEATAASTVVIGDDVLAKPVEVPRCNASPYFAAGNLSVSVGGKIQCREPGPFGLTRHGEVSAGAGAGVDGKITGLSGEASAKAGIGTESGNNQLYGKIDGSSGVGPKKTGAGVYVMGGFQLGGDRVTCSPAGGFGLGLGYKVIAEENIGQSRTFGLNLKIGPVAGEFSCTVKSPPTPVINRITPAA